MAKTKKKSKKKEPKNKTSGATHPTSPAPAMSASRTTPDSAAARKRARIEAASPAGQPSVAMQIARRRGVRSVLPRVVPWRDWPEWDDVRVGLMGVDTQEAARAIGRVRAWQSRGKVPHSVEATAALVEIGLSRSTGVPVRSENELRLMYSMALVRLVNGIVDAVQQKKFASPVSDLAGQVALPRILVDIRHTASHNALPSLPALSLAADRALQWLRQHYWDPQAAAVHTPPARTVEPLLQQYVRVRSRLVAAATKILQPSEQEVAQEVDTEAQKREDKRLKRQASASDLLASILASTPALDIAEALVEPIIKTSARMLVETLQDLGLQHLHRDTHTSAPTPSNITPNKTASAAMLTPTPAGTGTTPKSKGKGAGEGAGQGVTHVQGVEVGHVGGGGLSEEQEELGECVKYVISIWDEAMEDFEGVFPAFRGALKSALLARLHGCSLLTSSSSASVYIAPSVQEEVGLGAGERDGTAGVGASVGIVVERESWLCLVSTWLMQVGIEDEVTPLSQHPSTGGGGAQASWAASTVSGANGGGGRLSALQQEVVRGCVAAPSVWTRQLVRLVLGCSSASSTASSSVFSTSTSSTTCAHAAAGKSVTKGGSGTPSASAACSQHRRLLLSPVADKATHLLELLLHASAPPLAPAAPASDKGTTPAAAAPSTSSTHSDAAGGEEMKDGEQGSGSSTEEFEKLSAQLAAWHHQALSAAPGSTQGAAHTHTHPTVHDSGVGVGGGAWRRVSEWQTCPIGVVLGEVQQLELPPAIFIGDQHSHGGGTRVPAAAAAAHGGGTQDVEMTEAGVGAHGDGVVDDAFDAAAVYAALPAHDLLDAPQHWHDSKHGAGGGWEEEEYASAPWLKERRLLLGGAQDLVTREASLVRLLV